MAQVESGSHCCVQSAKHVRTRVIRTTRGHDRVVRKDPNAHQPVSLNGPMVQGVTNSSPTALSQKVMQRQHPPYMALVECDSLDFDDCITGKFPSGKCHGEENVACRTGANAVTLSRVLPFCVTH